MFRPLYVGHLQVEIQLIDQLYKMCGRLSGDWVGGRGGTQSHCFNNGYHDPGCYKWIFSLVVYVHMSSGLLFLC